jgi:hypothetical protein
LLTFLDTSVLLCGRRRVLHFLERRFCFRVVLLESPGTQHLQQNSTQPVFCVKIPSAVPGVPDLRQSAWRFDVEMESCVDIVTWNCCVGGFRKKDAHMA